MYWRIAPPPNLSSSVILILHLGAVHLIKEGWTSA